MSSSRSGTRWTTQRSCGFMVFVSIRLFTTVVVISDRITPGARKTKLVSKVVDHYTLRPDTQALVYFYCDRNDEPRRQPESVLRSFVRQLSYRKKDDEITLQKALIQLY